MKLKDEYNIRKVMDSFVAVPSGSNPAKYGEMIRMNETGAFIFEQLKYETSEDELVQMLCVKYDAEEALLRKDVRMFLRMLEERRLI